MPRHCGHVVGDVPGSGAVALAGFAGLVARNLDAGLDALRRLLELDLEVVAKVGAALRAGAAAAAAEAENVAEAAEDVFEAGELRRIESLRAADAGVAEAIVARALVAVAEDGVRLGRFLECVLGLLVARVAIGVELQRQLAIRALDLLIGRGARDLEDLVVVALAHDALATLTMRGTQQAIAKLVALGHHADDFAFARAGHFLVGDRLVQVRIEVGAQRVDHGDAALLQQIGELPLNQLEAGLVGLGLRRRLGCQRAIEIVDDRAANR